MYHIFIIGLVGALGWLIAKQASATVWSISLLLLSLLGHHFHLFSAFWQFTAYFLTAAFALFAIKPLRQRLLTQHIMKWFGQSMPTISSTEREALEAGTVGWEGELFTGNPDFSVLMNAAVVNLTEEEQAFLDGPVNALCRMIDDWDITHERADMPPEVWAFIKEQGFLGMIIPKQYGGLDFSASAQMAILVKLYGRSITVATTVAVPNSLGPGELLLKYGTTAQKDYYLPRLARGLEIPCFALTGPNAGSDAASIPDTGIVCYQTINGKKELGMLLNWDKRYITLCPVATVIGLAFRILDPDNILGKGEDVGISCALISANTPGIVKGRRHFPLNIAFMNGPTQGKNVFVPLDCLIGGVEMAGQGWRMLMECLSVGRAISLPASASGCVQTSALASGAYARVRKQFNQPIGKFEGIEEPLARIAANTYIIDAALTMTAAAIDQGEKPAVAGAILKYHTTERSRQVGMDVMDIHGGKGICLGPNNYLGRNYQGAPIGITVEGANILSRSLIIFGQGVIRCHPYIFNEIESVRNHDLVAFDGYFWSHAAFVLSNIVRSLFFSVTKARFTETPDSSMSVFYQQIHRYSSYLAFLSDFSMVILGASLKRKEKISARLGDLLSYLYLASAVLKRFKTDGEPAADAAFVKWSCQHLFYEAERAIQGVIHNFPHRAARIVLKIILQPFGSREKAPSDKLGQDLARILTEPNDSRSRLARLAFTEPLANCPLGRLEAAFAKICMVEDLEKKVNAAVKAGKLQAFTLLLQIEEALEQGLLTKNEAQRLREAELARQGVIAVDDFNSAELSRSPAKKAEKNKATS